MLDKFKEKLTSALPVSIEPKTKPPEKVYKHMVYAEVVGTGKNQQSYYIFKCPRVKGGELVEIRMQKYHRPLRCPVCGDNLSRDCFTGDMPPIKTPKHLEATLDNHIAIDGEGFDIG